MASLRTLAKRAEERRTWTVTFRRADGKVIQAPYSMVVANGKTQRVRLPSKREREAMARAKQAAKEAQGEAEQ